MTLMDRKKTDRERQKRFRDSVKAKGLKDLRVQISPEAKAAFEAEKDRTGETYAEIIERCACQLGDVNRQIDRLVRWLLTNPKKIIDHSPASRDVLKIIDQYFEKYRKKGIFD